MHGTLHLECRSEPGLRLSITSPAWQKDDLLRWILAERVQKGPSLTDRGFRLGGGSFLTLCFARNESLWRMYRNQQWTHFPHLKFCNDLMHNGFCMSQCLHNHPETFQTIKLQKRFIFRNIIESSRACWTTNALFVIDALCSVFEGFVRHTQFSLGQRTLTVGFLLHNKYLNNLFVYF